MDFREIKRAKLKIIDTLLGEMAPGMRMVPSILPRVVPVVFTKAWFSLLRLEKFRPSAHRLL